MIDFRERHVMALVIKAARVLYDLEGLAPLHYRSSFFAVLNFVVKSWSRSELFSESDPARNGDVINKPFVVDEELPASIGKLNCIASLSGLSGKCKNWRINLCISHDMEAWNNIVEGLTFDPFEQRLVFFGLSLFEVLQSVSLSYRSGLHQLADQLHDDWISSRIRALAKMILHL